ncbi:hypothetical protein [uncultured Hydrogenophaga sp.]|uniref:hypothetical protein n=1 Tax=uncultured Hydrogenophaga sp. TaxID=199683 RepID=UPI00265EA8BA|nr:hypothetical protein [uncultured Hydrogenophaga sp.]
MKLGHRLLFTAIALVLVALGVMAIVTETHTGSSRYSGVRTLIGDDAVWFGQTCLLLAVLPLLVWVPRARVGLAVAAWWLSLVAWLFLPLMWR